jgi:hypothetical protein
MSKSKPTRAARVTDAQRAAQVEALTSQLTEAAAVAMSNPSTANWTTVATYAGNVQRRAPLLAGLGRAG